MTTSYAARDPEPKITVNGIVLTTAQAMTVRAALASFEPDCGPDELGKAMTEGYLRQQSEVLEIMLGKHRP